MKYLIACFIACAAYAITVPFVITVGGDFTFTPLHTYYIAPSGCSDSNNGTSTATPWCSPEHAAGSPAGFPGFVCGDVVLVQPGSYTTAFSDPTVQAFGAVTNCPSTTGGIDGAGGIYFATMLCAGTHLGDCTFNSGAFAGVTINVSNWAVEGLSGTQNADGHLVCFWISSHSGTASTANTTHHMAYINNIANSCDLAGFNSGPNFDLGGSPASIDQHAFIGNVAFNAAHSLGGPCGSNFSINSPADGPDSSSGTHIFVSQNFSYKGVEDFSPPGCTVGGGTFPHSDGEGLILDSWELYTFSARAVVKNNVFWSNGNKGIESFDATGETVAQRYIYNNTLYGNMIDSQTGGAGEMYLHEISPTTGGFYSVTNNIFEANLHSPGGAGVPGANNIVAIQVECNGATDNNCTSATYLIVDGNYAWNSLAPTSTLCDSTGNNTLYFIGAVTETNCNWNGTNTFSDPGLTSPGTLPTTAPNTTCASYTNVVDCMNTGLGIYSKIKPTIAPTSIGYQPPGPCTADADYPTWLKGVVYLQASGWVNGATITEKAGLVTKPCNM
jgi:hypothetical protein